MKKKQALLSELLGRVRRANTQERLICPQWASDGARALGWSRSRAVAGG